MVSLQSLRPILSLPGGLFGSTCLSFDSRTSERYIVQGISSQEYQHMEKSLAEQFNRYLYIAALNIPGTLQLLSSAQDNQQNTQLIFKYIEGMSLYESLSCRGRGFSLIEARNMLRDIVKVYHRFEKYGVLHHRNIKLENIYYGTSSKTFSLGGLEMADFCGSTLDSSNKAIWGKSHQSQVCGNLDTLPPETLEQLFKLLSEPSTTNPALTPMTRNSDVFSLAYVCLQMIAPRIIFEQSTSAGPKPISSGRKDTSNLSDFFSPQGIARFQQDRSRRIADALEHIDREHGRDHPFMRQLDMTSFLQLLRVMLDPNPEKRCTFKYLYEFFDVREAQSLPRQIVEARMATEPETHQLTSNYEQRIPSSTIKAENSHNTARAHRVEVIEKRVQSSSKPTEYLQKKPEETTSGPDQTRSAIIPDPVPSQMQEDAVANPSSIREEIQEESPSNHEVPEVSRNCATSPNQEEPKMVNSVPETMASMENVELSGQEADGQPWNFQDPTAIRPTVIAEKIKILSDPNIAMKVASMENVELSGQEADGQPWNFQDPTAIRPTVIAEKIKILSDPNIAMKVVSARRVFFHKVSHQFMRIQLLICGALEFSKLAAIPTPPSPLSRRTHAFMSLIAYLLFNKAELYQKTLHDNLALGFEGIGIKDFSLYKESSVYDFDREYMKKIASLEQIPGAKEVQRYVIRVLSMGFLKTPHNTSQLASIDYTVPLEEIFQSINSLMKDCTKALRQTYSIDEIRFADAYKEQQILLNTLAQEHNLFGPIISDPRSIHCFEWTALITTTLNATVGTYTFIRITLPEETESEALAEGQEEEE